MTDSPCQYSLVSVGFHWGIVGVGMNAATTPVPAEVELVSSMW